MKLQYRMEDVKIPNFRHDGKVAIVTGGTSGIGYAIALTYANYGADVVVAARTAEDCERVAKEIESLGVRGMGIPTNVNDPAQVKNLVDTTVAKFGKLDIMVCGSGIGSSSKSLDTTPEAFDKVIDIDLKGVFLCANAAAEQMIAQGNGGRIIPISSMAAFSGSIGLTAYCAAKAGVVGMIRAQAVEWARYNITINALCPGYVATSINADAFQNQKVLDGIVKNAPLRRLGTMEEMAAGALYLASDFAGYTTGTTLLMDGGTNAW